MTHDADQPVPDLDERLFAYVDGELEPEARAAFEAEMGRDAKLRARAALLGVIESEAKAQFEAEEAAPPSMDGPIRFEEAASRLKHQPGRRWFSGRSLAYAAALALLAGVFGTMQWSAYQQRRPDTAAIYASLERRFEPEHVCRTSEEFIDYTRDAYGVAIDADFSTPVALVGWTYPMTSQYTPDADIVGPRLLMARSAEGEEVLVFFEGPGDASPRPARDAGLRHFKRRVGPVTLHEFSPLDEPVVLDLISLPG